MPSRILNGHFEKQRSLDARHHDKRMLFKLILYMFTFLFLMAWVLTCGVEATNRITNLFTRMTDAAITLIVAAMGALGILMRATPEGQSGQRTTDVPPTAPATPTPEEPPKP